MTFFSLQKMSAGYGPRTVLEDVSLTLPEGGITLIVGANASGKSTIFKTLFGLADLHSFHAFEFLGRPIRPGARDPLFRRHAAFVPQGQNVFSALSVRDNLEIALGASWPSRPGDIAEVLGPNLQARMNEMAGNLSGGQRQLLALSMGLRPGCRLLLLDEPLAGIDTVSTSRIVDVIAHVAKSQTVVIAEHRYAQFAHIANRLIGLRQGRIVLDLPDVRSMPFETLAEKTAKVFFG